MSNSITNSDDIIDSRNIIARIKELEDLRDEALEEAKADLELETELDETEPGEDCANCKG